MTKKVEKTLLNLKVSPELRKEFQAKANKHTKGNVSKWLRLAGKHYRPLKKDMAA